MITQKVKCPHCGEFLTIEIEKFTEDCLATDNVLGCVDLSCEPKDSNYYMGFRIVKEDL